MGGTTHTLRPKSYQTSSSVSRTYILPIWISTLNIFRQSFSKLNRSLTVIKDNHPSPNTTSVKKTTYIRLDADK